MSLGFAYAHRSGVGDSLRTEFWSTRAQLVPLPGLRSLGLDGKKGGCPQPSKPGLGISRETKAQR